MNDQLSEFVTQARAAGETDEQIQASLLQAGWEPSMVQQALRPIAPVATPTATTAPTQLFDQQFKDTLLWTAAAFALQELINAMGAFIGIRMVYSGLMASSTIMTTTFPYSFIGVIVSTVLTSVLLAKYFPFVRSLNQQYCKGKLNTLFKLIFYPALIVSVLSIFLGSVLASGLFGKYVILSMAIQGMATLGGAYICAHIISKQLTRYYPVV